MKPCEITPNYKFNEVELIKEFHQYVNSTYVLHYAKEKFQATEFVIDGGHGTGFCIGNVLKYAQRYGKKGKPEDHRKDLLKVLHYALIQLYIHDEEQSQRPKVLSDYMNQPAPGHHSIDDITPEQWDAITKGGTQTVLDFNQGK